MERNGIRAEENEFSRAIIEERENKCVLFLLRCQRACQAVPP